MNKVLNKGLALVIVMGMIGVFWGGRACLAAPPDVDVSVVLESSLNLSSTPLNFGKIDYTPIGGSIVMDAIGATDTSHNLILESGLGSSDPAGATLGSIIIASQAIFTVTAAYADTDLVADPTNGTTLTLNEIGTYSTTTVDMDGSSKVLYVGGKLNVPVSADDATYNGTIVVTLTYSPTS